MIGKLLTEVEKAEPEHKRALLLANKSPALMEVLLIAAGVKPFNPELVVDYTPSGFDETRAGKRLISEHSTFYIYRRTAGDIVAISTLFNRMLNNMTSEEAEHLVAAHEATLLDRLGLSVDDLRDVFGDPFEDAMDVAAFDDAKKAEDGDTVTLDELKKENEDAGEEIGFVEEGNVNEDAVAIPPITEPDPAVVEPPVAPTTPKPRAPRKTAPKRKPASKAAAKT